MVKDDMNNPTDITGREIKVGDVLACAQRYGNSGKLVIRVVADVIGEEIKTTVGGRIQYSERTIIVPKEFFIESEFWDEVKDAN